MKILFLGGNLSKSLSDWIEQQGEIVVYREDKVTINDMSQICPDLIISYNYKYLIPREVIDYVNGKAINLHIAYLPYNRGAHPNVWSFLEDTPKGVTIHYIDEGIDTGDIIVQREVFIDENKETLKSSYEILHREIQKLFKENWVKIRNGEINPMTQTGGGATTTCASQQYTNHSSKKRVGIYRLKNSRKNLTNGRLSLRDANDNDVKDLFVWRNHPEVRKNSFNTNPISWDEHKKWFWTKIKDQNVTIYIAYYRKNKVGSIRFEVKDNVIRVSVMLNPAFLGRGIGSEIIRLGTEKFISEKRPKKSLIAEIKKDNITSIKAFQKAGFKESHCVYVFNLKMHSER